MTVTELIDRILAAYPGADPAAMATFKPVFHARFGKREGPHLQAAFEATLAEFRPKYGQPFPIPVDFERHMPSLKPEASKADGGPPIDIPARNRRADQLFADWQRGQGVRAGRRNPKLIYALENIARQVADVMGWDENPKPLVLTREQLMTAAQRAISLERLPRFGQLPNDRFVWWEQIQTIATEWGLNIPPDLWDKETAQALATAAGELIQTRVRLVATTPPAPAKTLQDLPAPPSPAMKASLLRSAIKFHRDMGFEEIAQHKERELADLEAQLGEPV